VTRTGADIGAGLAPARAARPIPPGERIHVVGAAGAGASAAAQLALAAGARVSGCDPGGPTPYTAAFAQLGIPLEPRHDASHVRTEGGCAEDVGPAGVRVVERLAVTKALTAVQPNHPELVAARDLGLPVEPWQQLIADAAASHGGHLVAVAGTHGKSTSSGWLVHLLVVAGRDPAAFVGALLPAEDAGGRPATARWGRGDAFVVEADEYAGNFDPYRPDIAVVLNAEWDHPDVFPDEAAVLDAFEAWLRAPGAGTRRIVLNVADAGGAALARRLTGLPVAPVHVRLGEAPAADKAPGGRGGTSGEVLAMLDGEVLTLRGLPLQEGHAALTTRLALPGRHNAANAACVATAAALLGVPAPAIAAGLSSFAGVGRRLELKGEPGGVTVLDDYAHHPTAIRATIASVRQRYGDRRLWAVHEPLTFHRTAAMLLELAEALADGDEVVIADIWAGRDPDTTIASARELAAAVSALTHRGVAAPGSPEDTAAWLAERVKPGDIVLVMGGGRSYVIGERLVSSLSDPAGR
jgi:UDP-N-acetylmuramate--alanine ligase